MGADHSTTIDHIIRSLYEVCQFLSISPPVTQIYLLNLTRITLSRVIVHPERNRSNPILRLITKHFSQLNSRIQKTKLHAGVSRDNMFQRSSLQQISVHKRQMKRGNNADYLSVICPC